MNLIKRLTSLFAMLLFMLALLAGSSMAQKSGSTDLALPAPQKDGGKPLMQTLAERKTTRSFSGQELSAQQLSNLLWAAFGVNRPAEGKKKPGRTAPSAMNAQEVEIYVLLSSGTYLYEPVAHTLKFVIPGDARAKVGPPPAANAAVTLVYVAKADIHFAQVDVGFVGQNVYLYAASEGLNAWFYHVDEKSTAEVLKLGPDKEVLYAQSVGAPKK